MEPARRRLLLALTAVLAVALAVAIGLRLGRRPASISGLEAVTRVIPADERILVEVLNAGGRTGAARQATRVLRRAGFDVVLYGTAAAASDTTVVVVRRGEGDAAALLVRALGTGVVRADRDTLLRVDYTVLVGPEWRPPGFIP